MFHLIAVIRNDLLDLIFTQVFAPLADPAASEEARVLAALDKTLFVLLGLEPLEGRMGYRALKPVGRRIESQESRNATKGLDRKSVV
jgi:hypothetical protein